MTTIVREVQGRRDLRRFVAFADAIYAGDAHRVAPLRGPLLGRLARARRGGLRLLLAERAGRMVGTISVQRDRRHEAERDEAVCFFGFFECRPGDQEAARALVDAARAQARAWGATALRGPRNFSRVEAVGVLVQGHDCPPPMLAAHTAAGYAELLEGCGLVPHHDVLAYETPLVQDGRPRALPDALRQRADAVAIPGLIVRDAGNIPRDLRLAHRVFVGAFRDVPDNTPMPLLQWLAIGWIFLLVTDRRMLQIATVDGQPAGFALCFPELNEAVSAARGRLLPWGWWRVLRALPAIRTASFKLIGVMPEHRSSGLHAAMIARAIDGVQRAGYQRLEASLIDARNAPSRALVERSGMTVYKRYRVYRGAVRPAEATAALAG